MTLDKELHRQVLLEVLNKTSCPGAFAREMVALIDAVESAEVREPQSAAASATSNDNDAAPLPVAAE